MGNNTPTFSWLRAKNAPNWRQMPKNGVGYTDTDTPDANIKDSRVEMNWGTDWLISTIKQAGIHFENNYRKGNNKVSLIYTNDLSLKKGGDTLDHLGHETGLLLDIRLPHFGGKAGGITWKKTSIYDRNAARAMIQAFRAQPLFKRCFFNDTVLIAEGLCEPLEGHDNHIHISIKPPALEFDLKTVPSNETILAD